MNRLKRIIFLLFMLAVIIAGTLVCDEDESSDEKSLANAEVAGTYLASTVVVDGQEFITGDNEIEITLTTSGTTSGNLFIAGANEGGGDLEADMAGSYSINGSTITFDQAADTFVRDPDWIYSEGTLASGDFADALLVRQ